MLKFLQKMLLIAALCVPWVTQAQELSDYEFRTGVDNSAWITLSNPTTLLGDGTYVDDSPASSITNIGFNFPFGDGSYSQFWVNANGMFSFSSSTTTTTTAGQFTSSYYSTALPKISGIARDMSTGSNGYIKYQLMGTAPERVLVCEFALSYTYGSSYAGDVKWQIQLHEDSSKVVIVYGPAPGTVPSSFQSGLGAASDDIVILNPSTHAPIYLTTSHATTYSTWHGAYRYYEFVRPNITCPKPLVLNAIPSADEMTLYWTPGGTETQWEVTLGEDTVIVTDTFYTFTNLNANTLYAASVRAICGADDMSGYRSASFRTSCVFIEEAMLPVTENFETYGTGTTAFPTCWYKLGSTADRPYINATTSYGHNNTYGLYFYAAAGGYCYGVMPPVDPTVDLTTLQVSFWARQYSTSYNCDFVVGVMTDPANASTFTPVGQVHPNGTTYEFFEVPLTTYTGTGNYIAFQAVQHPGTSTAIYLMLDDVTLDYTPACPTPISLNADSVASDVVNLYWEDPINSEWLLIYGPSGFNPDTAVTNVLTLTDTTVLISDLTANTLYDFYLAALCIDGDTTMFRMISVRTACEAISILPYSENFDTYGAGTTVIPNCWYKLGSTADRPYINSSTTYGHNGTYGLYFYAVGSGYCYGIMPPVDPTLDLTTLQVSFWARQYSTSYNCDFVVGVMTNPSDVNTFTPVGQVHPTSTTYEYFEVPLTTYTGTGTFIAFKAVQHPGSSTDIYMMLDDVTLETQPTCPGVANLETNVTVGSAMLTWQTRTSGTGEVESYTVDVTDSTGTTTTYTTSDMYYLLSGLTAGSEYKVVVTPDCGNDGYGHSDSVVFHTEALACLEMDETTLDTIAFSNSTSGISGCLAYSSYGNTVYQTIYTAAELTAAGVTAGPVTGIDLGFTACSSYNKEFTIFIGNSNTTSISNATMEDPNNQLQVYGPALHPMNTTGWQHYDFTTPFMWDGTSSIIVTTFMNQTGGSQSSSTGLTGYYVSASNKARYRYKDSSPFTLTDFNSGNAGSTYSYRAAIHFYQGECMTMASCAAPNVEVTDVQSDEATIAWIPGYDESAWDIDYRVAGASAWTIAATGVSTTSYTFSNLTSATDYEFRVSFECSGDNETYSSVVSASTLCDDVTLPYIQGFENVTTSTSSTNYDVMPNCWDYILTGSGSYITGTYLPGVYYSSSYANTGNYSLRLAGKGYFMLPPVATSLDSVSLSMNCYITSSGYNIEVGVMEANGTFVPISQHVLTTSQHTPIEVSFASYTGNSRVIALHNYYSTYDYSYVYIDDIVVDYLPECPRIEGVTVNHIGQNQATVHWTASTPGDYEVLVGLTGFNPGDSIPVTVNGVDSIDLTNLSPSTTYDVYVREVCTGGGYGAWSYVHTFRTDCGPITVLPYFEGFESYPVGSSTATMYEIPCWARLDNAGQNHFGYVNSASSWAAGPHTGDKFIYYYLPTNTGTHADWLLTILPTIDTNVYPMNTLQLSFWVRMNSASTSSFIEVGVISDATDETTFTPVDTVPVSGDVHTLKTAYLSNFTGSGDRIAMRFHRTTESTAHYFFIDDIAIEQIPDCPPVSNITLSGMTSDSLYVIWTENGDATSWTVEYGPSGFTPGNGTTGIVTSLPMEIGGLTANTAYDVYVTPECNDGVAATRMGTFRTNCGPTPVPFTESFDTWSSTAADPLPNCWEKHTNYSTNYPYASTSYGHSGGKSMYMYSTNTTYSYMVLPQFDLPIDSTLVSFWLYKSNTSYAHKLLVGVMTNPADVNSFVQVAEVVPTLTSTWEEFEVPLSSYTGTGTRIAIMSPNNEYSYPYLDDLTVTRISGCMRVVDLIATNVTLDSATISWTDGSNTSWNVEYDTVDFIPGTTGHNLTQVTDTFCILSGLSAGTIYHVYVYPDCDSSIAERHMTFTTLASAPATVPYSCDFEAAGVNGWDLIQAGQHNYWVVGNATSNGGNKSMYITNNGSAYTYDGAASYSFAVRTFNLQAGNYVCSYDWKCNGESSFDFIRAALVPAGANITAGDYSGFDNTSAMPSGSIALDGGYRLNLQGTTWQSQVTEFTLTSAGTYKIVFLWRNDGSVYNQPPAAIDNVQLELNNCPMPLNITATTLTQTSADISWDEPGTATQWQYQLGSNAPVIVTDTFCTVTGLAANSEYTFRVRSICGQGDTSMWASYTFRTPCGYLTLPYIEDFETYGTGTTAFPSCWYKIGSTADRPYIYATTSYGHNNSHPLYFYAAATGYCYAVMPPVDPTLSLSTLQVSFWARQYSTSYNCDFVVGVMTDPTNVSTFTAIDTVHPAGTTYEQFDVPLLGYTGTGNYIAFSAVQHPGSTSAIYMMLDDVVLEPVPTCLIPQDVTATEVSTTSITIDWTDLSTASAWEIRYGVQGSSNTNSVVTTSHPYTISGLNTLTSYNVEVRAICTVGDTSRWSNVTTLGTSICDNSIEATTGPASGTQYYTPLNNYYNYTLTETIIDSAELAEIGDIIAIAYSYNNTSASTVKTNVSIYLKPTTKTVFSSSSDIELLDSTAVKVYEGPLNCSQGWNYFAFDTLYTWDGQSNLMVIVDDNSGDYDGSAYVFNSSSCTGYKTLVWYSDSYNPDPYSSSFSGTKTYNQYRATMMLVSCGGARCLSPNVLPTTDITYQSATINWNSNATDFEVAVRAATDAEYPAPTSVTGATSYTVSGLQPATIYRYQVRAICDATEELISDWVEGSFTTDSLPCFAPTDLHTSDLGYTTATLAWTAGGAETMWNIHVWNTSKYTNFTATGNPYTVTGLAQNTSYYAAISALCGNGTVESEYSDTIQFTTATCAVPTAVTTGNITATSVTVSWNGTAQSYEIEYGDRNFNRGEGTKITVNNSTTYQITGLESEHMYTLYVRSICETGLMSDYSSQVDFDTPAGEGFDAVNGGMNVSIYPNPTTNATTIALSGVNGEVSITIVDMNGRIVMSDSMSCEGDCTKTLEVSGLAQGDYFVRLNGDNVNMVKKLVVK